MDAPAGTGRLGRGDRRSWLRRAATLMAIAVAASAGRAEGAGAPSGRFVFTVTTPAAEAKKWIASLDTGMADTHGEPFGYDGLEQRLGLMGSLGRGFTVAAQVGLGIKGDTQARGIQQLELLKDVLPTSGRLRLGVGAGIRREWDGTSVLLGRITTGGDFGSSSLFGNVRFERPLAHGRDEVDLIATAGWLQRVGSTLHVGIETIAEDIEGFWEEEEAEGGAKLFLGPSLHIAPPQRSWSVSVCGGPVLHATRSDRTSVASRQVGASSQGSYLVRVSLGYSF